MIRVLVIEYHSLARDGLVLLINNDRALRVSHACATIEQALASPAATRSDAALLDVDDPTIELDVAVEKLRTRMPRLRIVVLASQWTDEAIALALAADVNGYVLKEENFSAVSGALRRVCDGEYSYSRRVRTRIVKSDDGADSATVRKTRAELLTQRERQLLRLIASGQTLRNACASLGISYKTADKHKVNLMKKLDIHDRVELARYAIREGIINA
ncbi:MAG TPA: response regulator transcription factor [Phycisphaerae bacterium]|nr:response regulator transcription factor [Phycisphaerales bacterium]HRX86503.1 response regulator transcription factor [Phycisphaerae bacterium]